MTSKALTTREEHTINQHIEDLRERMKILKNDRKANMEVLQATKNANIEEIKKLRDDNSNYRSRFSELQETTVMDRGKDEEKHISQQVDRYRRQYDDLRMKSQRFRKNLEDLRDKVRDLELDSQKPHMEDNEYTRTIRALENKLDKAMIKFNEAQSIRKTYEQIVRRLKEERVGFDNQLAAIERTLEAKKRDFEELLLLAGDANHAREAALVELDRVRAGYEDERKRRNLELKEKKQVVELRKQMLDRIKQREQNRAFLTSTEAHEKSNSAMSAMNQKMITTEKIETRNKIDIFENAFRKIKEATGVSDVNEVISKIVSQKSTTENLIALTRENQAKIEVMNDKRKRMKTVVEELKYSGKREGSRRKLVDEQEDQLATTGARLERARLKYERLNKVIIAMKAGVGHLQDKLEPVRDELGGKKLELTDESIAEVLRECEHNLSTIMRRLQASEADMKRAQSAGRATTAGSQDSQASGPAASMLSPGRQTGTLEEELNITARPYNQRIDLKDFDFEGEEGDTFDETGLIAGMITGNEQDDDELTREKVKRASSRILENFDRKKRKPKKKGGAGKPGPSNEKE